MAHVKFHKYPGKIILFGEYLVLSGGKALAIPLSKYHICKTFKPNSNKSFYFDLYNYIAALPQFEGRISSKFRKEIYSGLHYISSIPIGYGLGSSGALVANVYADYIKDKKTDLMELKSELAAIEGFFHQKSSGLDPLTSYLEKPILIEHDSIRTDLTVHHLDRFYLHDSEVKRSSKNAISHYEKLKEDPDFQKGLHSLSALNNSIIEKIIRGEGIRTDMKNFSILQMNLFWDFIPSDVQKLWERGINLDSYFMKLCGAGMGGMFLVYSPKYNKDFKKLI